MICAPESTTQKKDTWPTKKTKSNEWPRDNLTQSEKPRQLQNHKTPNEWKSKYPMANHPTYGIISSGPRGINQVHSHPGHMKTYSAGDNFHTAETNKLRHPTCPAIRHPAGENPHNAGIHNMGQSVQLNNSNSAGDNPQIADTKRLIQTTETLCGQLIEVLKVMNQTNQPTHQQNNQHVTGVSQTNPQQSTIYPMHQQNNEQGITTPVDMTHSSIPNQRWSPNMTPMGITATHTPVQMWSPNYTPQMQNNMPQAQYPAQQQNEKTLMPPYIPSNFQVQSGMYCPQVA